MQQQWWCATHPPPCATTTISFCQHAAALEVSKVVWLADLSNNSVLPGPGEALPVGVLVWRRCLVPPREARRHDHVERAVQNKSGEEFKHDR